MSEQQRTANRRPYRMRQRADHVSRTRERIIEATVQLHGSIGFAATTVAGIAHQAGVTRLTVYRHFPDIESLFAACSAHWAAQQVRPDPAAWAQIPDPDKRLRAGLTDLYRFYRAGAAMLTNVNRERDVLPAALRQRNENTDARMRDTLLEPFDVQGSRRRRLRALLGHAVSFSTWRSLCVEQGLSDHEAVEALAGLACSAASGAS